MQDIGWSKVCSGFAFVPLALDCLPALKGSSADQLELVRRVMDDLWRMAKATGKAIAIRSTEAIVKSWHRLQLS